MGAIAGGVAHEFNNLLSGILGHAELATATLPGNSPAQSHLSSVVESAMRAADLSRQMLAYTGKGRLVIRPIDVNSALIRALDLGAKGIPNGIQIRKKLAAHLPTIDGDETQIQQVILNLLRNAREAIADNAGGIHLETALDRVAEGEVLDPGSGDPLPAGNYVRVTVSDTGSGIPADVIPRMFEPFFTTKFVGRGLGLAAVHGIVRGHNGGIRVISTAGKGTEFTVYFPVGVAGVARVTKAPTPEVPILRPQIDDCRHVLVVDDEESVREMTACMLRQLGWEVVTAVDGKDGVTRFRKQSDQIRFVVLDLNMPVMDGWQVLSAMRRMRPELPVLLCTGHNQDSVFNPDPAITGVVFKPFRIAELQQSVSRLLSPIPIPAAAVASS
jgi:CheY-like chemotaxis protein